MFMYGLNGRLKVTGRDLTNHKRNIHMGGTDQPAWPLTVACMLTQQQIEGTLTGREYSIRISLNCHSLFGFCRTSGQ